MPQDDLGEDTPEIAPYPYAASGEFHPAGHYEQLPPDQVRALIAADHPWFRELAGLRWRLLELPTGHWPMFSRPEDLATLLLGLPTDTP